MAAGKKQKLDFDLQGLRYFRQLKPLLERLASIGCLSGLHRLAPSGTRQSIADL